MTRNTSILTVSPDLEHRNRTVLRTGGFQANTNEEGRQNKNKLLQIKKAVQTNSPEYIYKEVTLQEFSFNQNKTLKRI